MKRKRFYPLPRTNPGQPGSWRPSFMLATVVLLLRAGGAAGALPPQVPPSSHIVPPGRKVDLRPRNDWPKRPAQPGNQAPTAPSSGQAATPRSTVTAHGDRISIHATNMPVGELGRLIAEQAGFNLLVGDDVMGNLTLAVDGYPTRDVLGLLAETANAAVTVEAGVARIMSQERYERAFGRPYRETRRQEIFPVEHIGADVALAALTPLRSRLGALVESKGANAVLALDTPSRLETMRRLLSSIDSLPETRMVRVRGTSPGRVAERLGPYLLPSVRADPDSATGTILLTGPRVALDDAARMIALLDSASAVETRAFRVAYASPDTLRTLLKAEVSLDRGTVRVDEGSGSVFVTALPEELDRIAHTVQLLDVPIRQVLLDVQILQVTLDDEAKTGIDWSILEDRLNGTSIPASFPVLSDTDNGIRVSHDRSSDAVRFIAEALSTVGKTKLLASPKILVADGQTARIHVGSQVPYVAVDTREGANGVLDRFEKVSVLDVGTVLEVRAQMLGVDRVRLEIQPELTSVTAYSSDIPVVEMYKVATTLLIENRHTVILGGLGQDIVEVRREGVPLVDRIPLIKFLLASNVTHRVRTEIAILITPQLLRGVRAAAE